MVAASYLVHLVCDELENQTGRGAYSLARRALHGFRFEALSRDPTAAMAGRDEDMEKLRKLRARAFDQVAR